MRSCDQYYKREDNRQEDPAYHKAEYDLGHKTFASNISQRMDQGCWVSARKPHKEGEMLRMRDCCSVAKLCPTLFHSMDYSTPGFPVLPCLLEPAQTQVHWVGDAIQPSRPLSPPSPLGLNLSQHQGLSQWVNCLYQVTKGLELQFQHQSFQGIFRVDFL